MSKTENTNFKSPVETPLETNPLELENIKIESSSPLLDSEHQDEEDPADIIRLGSGHGLDYVNRKELQKKTGIYITPLTAFAFALRETMGNGTDKNSTTKIKIKVELGQPSPAFNTLKISDNGKKKLTRQDLEKNLDFDHNASSKRGIHKAQSGTRGK